MDIKNLDIHKVEDSDLDSILDALETLSVQTSLDYKPHAKQLLFHSASDKLRLLSGGNRSGKTEAGVWEDVAHATGLYPDWFPASNRIVGPSRGRVVVTDFKKGARVFEEKLWKWLPKDLVVSIKRTQTGAVEQILIKHKSGGVSEIELMSHEQDDDVFEGWSGHWAHFDEPPPREKFIATLRGLIDFAGRCWLTLTPISQPWLYDEFVSKANKDFGRIFFLQVDMWDNAKSRGGYLEDSEIEFFETTLKEDEKEARLHGRFKHLTGLVYKEFDPAIHVVSKSSVKIKKDWPKYFVCDPHDRKPHFGIWATVDPLGQVFIIDEIKYAGTIKQFSKQILLRELMNKEFNIDPREVIRIGDPNKMVTPTAVTGTTFLEEFASSGLYFLTNVNNDIALGHLAVQDKLWYDKSKPHSSTNKPKLYWFRETTQECVRYMQLYVWDDWKGSSKDTRSLKEKPQESFKDFPDTVRYLIMSRPTFIGEESDPEPYSNDGSVTGYR